MKANTKEELIGLLDLFYNNDFDDIDNVDEVIDLVRKVSYLLQTEDDIRMYNLMKARSIGRSMTRHEVSECAIALSFEVNNYKSRSNIKLKEVLNELVKITGVPHNYSDYYLHLATRSFIMTNRIGITNNHGTMIITECDGENCFIPVTEDTDFNEYCKEGDDIILLPDRASDDTLSNLNVTSALINEKFEYKRVNRRDYSKILIDTDIKELKRIELILYIDTGIFIAVSSIGHKGILINTNNQTRIVFDNVRDLMRHLNSIERLNTNNLKTTNLF